MPTKASANFSKEEELLLQDFGRDLSRKSVVIFYIHALFISAIPIWLFNRIHQMELTENAILFVAGTVVSTYLVSLAYKNNKFQLKHKIAQKRGEGVAAEVYSKFAQMDKKISKKEKDDRILWKKNEIAEAESMQLSVFYSNSLFLILLVLMSFFFFKNYAPMINYVITMLGASGITALLSTSSKN